MKIKLTSIELLGITGLLIWIITLIVRKTTIVDNTLFNLFWFAPNFGGAWFTTALLKQFFRPVGSTKPILAFDFSKKNYAIICIIVIILAILNEFAYPLNRSRAFDLGDVFATIIAQAIIFIVPLILKEI
ncbi:MAG: hypothetical protein PWQ93_343 [Clostridiales bacterium]|nr:hypothetical protein [Clostridiales bacterium]